MNELTPNDGMIDGIGSLFTSCLNISKLFYIIISMRVLQISYYSHSYIPMYFILLVAITNYNLNYVSSLPSVIKKYIFLKIVI